jgi:carboxymethylenebutenolidase
MGASFAWREPRSTEVRAFSKTVCFGGRRDATTGYLSFSNRVGPSVLVLHDFLGMQQSVRDFADGLRDTGFTVLAPDLYDGAAFDSAEHAHAMGFGPEATLRRALAAAEHLGANWHPTLGAVGFSLGAGLACALAQEGILEAAVVYYGTGDFAPARWRGAVQGHFPPRDEQHSDLSEISGAFRCLIDHGVEAELHLYPDTLPMFANQGASGAYDRRAEETARGRTIDFLRYHLA